MAALGLVVVTVDFEMMACFQRSSIVCAFEEEKSGLTPVVILFFGMLRDGGFRSC